MNGWAQYMLGTDEGTLWSKQREIARAVVENNSTAVKAGHVGKSRLMAVLICWGGLTPATPLLCDIHGAVDGAGAGTFFIGAR